MFRFDPTTYCWNSGLVVGKLSFLGMHVSSGPRSSTDSVRQAAPERAVDLSELPSLAQALNDFYAPAQVLASDFLTEATKELISLSAPPFWRNLRCDIAIIFPSWSEGAETSPKSAFGENVLRNTLRTGGVWVPQGSASDTLYAIGGAVEAALKMTPTKEQFPFRAENFCCRLEALQEVLAISRVVPTGQTEPFEEAAESKTIIFDSAQITSDAALSALRDLDILMERFLNGHCSWRCNEESLCVLIQHSPLSSYDRPGRTLWHLWNALRPIAEVLDNDYFRDIVTDGVTEQRSSALTAAVTFLAHRKPTSVSATE